jgi:hypothetical protein
MSDQNKLVEVEFVEECRHGGVDYKAGQKGKVTEVAKKKLKGVDKIK